MSLALVLKILLTPTFIGLVSLAGRRWGPQTSGWLAGLPVLVGPILFLLWLEHGLAFVRPAATYGLAGVFPVAVFCIVYTWGCRSWTWPATAVASYAAWSLAAAIMFLSPITSTIAGIAAVVSLLAAPSLMPVPEISAVRHMPPKTDLAVRMAVGLVLTLTVTTLSTVIGPRVAGMLSVSPIVTAVLAIFTHRNAGSHACIGLLRGLMRGIFSLTAFCWSMAALPIQQAGWLFASAALIALLVQGSLARGLYSHRKPGHS